MMKFWAGQTWQQGGGPRGVMWGGIVLLGGMSKVVVGGKSSEMSSIREKRGSYREKRGSYREKRGSIGRVDISVTICKSSQIKQTFL